MVGVVEAPAIVAAGFWAGMINVVDGSGPLVTFGPATARHPADGALIVVVGVAAIIRMVIFR